MADRVLGIVFVVVGPLGALVGLGFIGRGETFRGAFDVALGVALLALGLSNLRKAGT